MKAKEFQKILIEGLIHTDDSRTEFYLIKAKEYGYSPSTFFLGLKASYMELYKYVNSYHHDTWTTKNPDGTGEKIYPKKTINLLHLTNGEIRGFLDYKNIVEIAQGLRELGNMVRSHNTQSPDKWKPLHDGLKELGLIEESKNFSTAMEVHHLLEKDKIVWTGTKTKALFFSKQCKFSLPEFNKCFSHIAGRPFALNNSTNNDPDEKLKDLILRTYP